jgi:hypothetical protein
MAGPPSTPSLPLPLCWQPLQPFAARLLPRLCSAASGTMEYRTASVQRPPQRSSFVPFPLCLSSVPSSSVCAAVLCVLAGPPLLPVLCPVLLLRQVSGPSRGGRARHVHGPRANPTPGSGRRKFHSLWLSRLERAVRGHNSPTASGPGVACTIPLSADGKDSNDRTLTNGERLGTGCGGRPMGGRCHKRVRSESVGPPNPDASGARSSHCLAEETCK